MKSSLPKVHSDSKTISKKPKTKRKPGDPIIYAEPKRQDEAERDEQAEWVRTHVTYDSTKEGGSQDVSTDTLQVLLGMATDAAFLAAVAPHWTKLGLFHSTYPDRVGAYCLSYFRKHQEAPGAALANQLRKWAEQDGDKESVYAKLKEALERAERQQQAPLSTKALIELGNGVFQRAQLRTVPRIENVGNNPQLLNKALERLEGFTRIQLDKDEGILASEMYGESLRWLWEGWLAYKEMALIDGFTGQGKSLLTVDLAARVSRGWPMPPVNTMMNGYPMCPEVRNPAGVVLLSSEDYWRHTILPRLMAAGADLSRIVTIEDRRVVFPQDIRTVKRLILKHKAKLLIVDPVLAFIGDKTDINTENQVRDYLDHLLRLTRQTGIATILIRHFTKDPKHAMHRGLGSQAWTAFCRLQHVFGMLDPTARDGNPVLVSCKPNLCKRQETGFGFTIHSQDVTMKGQPKLRDGRKIATTVSCNVGRIEWTGPVQCEANDIALADRRNMGRPSDERDEAVDLIRQLLSKGPMRSKKLQKKVITELRVSVMTYKRARKKAGVESKEKRVKGKSVWYSYLPHYLKNVESVDEPGSEG